MKRRLPLIVAGASVSIATAAAAQTLPWADASGQRLPPEARSVLIERKDEPLRTRPDAGAPRRGSAAIGALLPLYGVERGPGCQTQWLLVGPTAWVCEDHVVLTKATPLSADVGPSFFANGLPLQYHFVGPDGSFGYGRLRSADTGTPDAQLEPGFAVAILQVANKGPGDPFGLTSKGLWIPMRDVHPVRELLFEGARLEEGERIAFVFADEAPLYDRPLGHRLQQEAYARFSRIPFVEERRIAGGRWFRVAEKQWVSGRHVRAATPAEPPSIALPGERWLDVEVDQQVLTAYEGARPVFTTLVSTGKGREGTELATPKGVHRVWVKLRTSDMTNLENEEASRYYAIQDVPWVMYFEKGYGLHGTFWHRQFGRVRSHGCVNLAPLDAQTLFHWTSPRLPAGWTAALPTDYDRGTIVRVR